MAFQGRDGAPQDADRRLCRGHRRVPALEIHAQFQADVPFFRQPDQGHGLGDTRHHPLQDEAALVQHTLEA